MSSLSDILVSIDDAIWYLAFVLIIIMGVVATVLLKGIQIGGLKEMVKVTFSREKTHREGKLSSFQVFCMSMGSRIGVGNITGPIVAILAGGPGAIFWMWVFAAIGTATSFLETTIGQIYKVPKENGGYRGGPAYTIFHGLGMKKLGMIAAVVMILMYLVGFVSGEVMSITQSLTGAFDFDGNTVVFALILTAITAFIVMGGVYRVADLSTKIVPLMALAWFVICIVSIALSSLGIVDAFKVIFEYAFSIPAFVGGGLGAVIMQGMMRGVWSNEAGIGTITNLSSMADVKHPVRQGYTQALGVVLDTVVSTVTALVILSAVDLSTVGDVESINLLQGVIAETFGAVAPYIICVFMFIFAYTCLMSDVVIGESNLMLIKENRVVNIGMKLMLLIVVFVSSFYASDNILTVMDILLAVCALFNAFILLRLGKRGLEAFRDYRAQKKEGIEEPVFRRSVLSDDSGVTEWND